MPRSASGGNSAEDAAADAAAQAYKKRQSRARTAVREGRMPEAEAERHLRPWLAIACLAGADLPELREKIRELMDPANVTHFPRHRPGTPAARAGGSPACDQQAARAPLPGREDNSRPQVPRSASGGNGTEDQQTIRSEADARTLVASDLCSPLEWQSVLAKALAAARAKDPASETTLNLTTLFVRLQVPLRTLEPTAERKAA